MDYRLDFSMTDKEDEFKRFNQRGSIKHGLTVLTTVLFVAGENAGVGILALPYALNGTGWLGVPLMLMICIDATIAASLIGKCWIILEERWPEYRVNCRNPYPEIGRMAFGERVKTLITWFVQIGSIGSSVVMLLVCSQLASDLIDRSHSLSYGVWIVIIAMAICPLMWLGTPVEFWGAAALALGTSTIAIVLLLIDMVKDLKALEKSPAVSEPTITSVSLAFGTLMFAYGGTAPFPTYQNDMKEKEKWPQAVVMGFIILFVLFTPFSIVGYITYGESASNNIIHSVQPGVKREIVTILMAGHLFFAFILMINPSVQDIENKIKAQRTFNWKRIAVRITMLLVVVFIGESIPRFGKVMDLLGGSIMTCLAYIFPPTFYLSLCSKTNPLWPDRRLSFWTRCYLYKIILIGVIGGVCATISAIMAIITPDAFVLPCYIDLDCAYESRSTLTTTTIDQLYLDVSTNFSSPLTIVGL